MSVTDNKKSSHGGATLFNLHQGKSTFFKCGKTTYRRRKDGATLFYTKKKQSSLATLIFSSFFFPFCFCQFDFFFFWGVEIPPERRRIRRFTLKGRSHDRFFWMNFAAVLGRFLRQSFLGKNRLLMYHKKIGRM